MTYIEISGSDHNKETARKLIEDLTGGFSEESGNYLSCVCMCVCLFV